MKTPAGDTLSAASQTVTRPFYIIDAYFPLGTVHHSTGEAVDLNGITYVASGAEVRSVSPGSAQVAFNNSDLSASSLLLGQDIRNARIVISLVYKSGAAGLTVLYPDFHALADSEVPASGVDIGANLTLHPIVVFDGVMDSVDSLSQTVGIVSCLGLTVSREWAPRRHIGPPLCNHLPVPGTVIGGFVLEPSRNG